MERHGDQEGTRADAAKGQVQQEVTKAQDEIARRIAEYEKAVESTRQKIEELRKQAQEMARARMAQLRPEKREKPPEEARPPEAPAAEAAPPEQAKPAEEAQGERMVLPPPGEPEVGAEPPSDEERSASATELPARELQPEATVEHQAETTEAAGAPEAMAEPAAEAGEPVAAEAEEERKPERPEAGTMALFDGTEESMGGWKKVGTGELELKDGQLQLKPARDRGLVYPMGRRFDDFQLRAQYRIEKPETPATVAVRFLDPEQPVPDREDSEKKYRYDNQAYVAVHTGFEVNLGSAEGAPGTFVGVPAGDEPGKQQNPRPAELKPDDWNALEVEVRGDDYTVRLNGAETARFRNDDPWRGRRADTGPEAGFVGFVMGEEPKPDRQKVIPRRVPGPLPPQLAGPLLPRGRVARPGGATPRREAPAAGLTLRSVEIRELKAAPKTREEKVKLAREDLNALHLQVSGALGRIKAKHPEIEAALDQAYGYAVLPAVGKAGLVLGAARGYGEVFEQGKPVGFTRVTQLTVGVQLGGQTVTELLLFGSKESLEAFKSSPIAFNANVAAAFVRGASGTTNFKDVTVHAYSQGGMVLEASLGGQKFRFLPETEAIEALLKSAEVGRARARVAQVGRAALDFGKRISAKAGGLLKRHRPQPQ